MRDCQQKVSVCDEEVNRIMAEASPFDEKLKAINNKKVSNDHLFRAEVGSNPCRPNLNDEEMPYRKRSRGSAHSRLGKVSLKLSGDVRTRMMTDTLSTVRAFARASEAREEGSPSRKRAPKHSQEDGQDRETTNGTC